MAQLAVPPTAVLCSGGQQQGDEWWHLSHISLFTFDPRDNHQVTEWPKSTKWRFWFHSVFTSSESQVLLWILISFGFGWLGNIYHEHCLVNFPHQLEWYKFACAGQIQKTKFKQCNTRKSLIHQTVNHTGFSNCCPCSLPMSVWKFERTQDSLDKHLGAEYDIRT